MNGFFWMSSVLLVREAILSEIIIPRYSTRYSICLDRLVCHRTDDIQKNAYTKILKHKLTSINNNFCFVDDQFFTPANVGPSSKLGLYSVHITLQDYAVSAISQSTTNIECSVESSECDGQINIIAKDLRLYSSGGQCFQNISINETEIGVINTFNCDDNTNFIQNLNFFKSQTNHIILTFTNSHQQPGGYFWIQLVSGNVLLTALFLH